MLGASWPLGPIAINSLERRLFQGQDMAHNFPAALLAVIALTGWTGNKRPADNTYSVRTADENYDVDFDYGPASSGHGTSWLLSLSGQDWRTMLDISDQEERASRRDVGDSPRDNGSAQLNTLVHAKITEQLEEAFSRVGLQQCKPEPTRVARLSDGGRAFGGWCDVTVDSDGKVLPKSAGVVPTT